MHIYHIYFFFRCFGTSLLCPYNNISCGKPLYIFKFGYKIRCLQYCFNKYSLYIIRNDFINIFVVITVHVSKYFCRKFLTQYDLLLMKYLYIYPLIVFVKCCHSISFGSVAFPRCTSIERFTPRNNAGFFMCLF